MKSILSHVQAISEQTAMLAGKKVLIIGDVGLDEYVMGQVRRISPEAPVPVVEVEKEDARLGLSANVAQNVESLGGEPILVAVVGADATAEQLGQLLTQARVSREHLVTDSSRPTTRKLRVMVQHHHIVRVDYEQRSFLSPELEQAVLDRVRAVIKDVVAVIIQDYAKGVISDSLVQEVVRIAHAHDKKVLVDPHRTTPLQCYRGTDIMTPNYEESLALSKIAIDDLRPDSNALNRIGKSLMDATGAPQMIITRGKEGMRLIEGQRTVDLPTYARQVFDVTGAGDTVIAALALAWGSGMPLERACVLANFAAGVVVGKVGCVPCQLSELLEYMQQHAAEISPN